MPFQENHGKYFTHNLNDEGAHCSDHIVRLWDVVILHHAVYSCMHFLQKKEKNPPPGGAGQKYRVHHLAQLQFGYEIMYLYQCF